MRRILFLAALTSVCAFAGPEATKQQTACIVARSQSGQPLFSALGVSGYAINQCTGERIVFSPELARLNNARKSSWKALGYTCTIDCSGHDAGRDWAEENDIDDESLCNGKSRSFNEGCWAYVRHFR